MKELMIGKLPFQRNRDEEPDYANRFIPSKTLGADSSVFESRFVQARAVEQFDLPRDEDLLRTVPDVGLHVILRSYLTRGCLVEKEFFRRLAQGRNAYEMLQRARAEGGEADSTEFDKVVAELSAKQVELDDWRREVEMKERLIADLKAEVRQLERRQQKGGEGAESFGSAEKALRERDIARAQLAMEQQISDRARSSLEEEQIAHAGLRERYAQLEVVLEAANKDMARLKSPEYEAEILEKKRSDIIEEFRHGVMGKTEVALACKAGSDYILAQLTPEQRGSPGQFRYPPVIADHVDVLADIENAGGRFVVEDESGEGEEGAASSESADSTDEDDASGSAKGGGDTSS